MDYTHNNSDANAVNVDPRVTITKTKVIAFENAILSALPHPAAHTILQTYYDIFPATNVRISKSKYKLFSEAISKCSPPHFEMALGAFQNAFHFNPQASTYTKELGKRMYARVKHKCEETGQSIYQLQRATLLKSIDKVVEQRLKERSLQDLIHQVNTTLCV